MNGRTTRLGALLLAAAAFALAAALETRVRAERPRLREGVRSEGETLPPGFQILSTLLGSFRSLLADFLWIRAQALEGEGRYYASAELARWITALQSRVEASWSFQAWNLGVNVPSVLPPEDRWPYVEAAIALLWRDGLAANPSSLTLYYEIGWFWQHRVGSGIDPAAARYQRIVRERVGAILGERPWDIGELAAAEELLPLLRKEPAVAALEADLAAAGASAALGAAWVAARREPPAALGDGAALDARIRADPILEAFDRAMRARAWREAFGLPLASIANVVAQYGDVDLGSPESFVVCFASRGIEKVEAGSVRLDALALWRLRFSALGRLFRRGFLHLASPIDDDYARLLALVAADPVHRNQEDVLARDRRAFLRLAVPLLYVNGRRRGAEALFSRLSAFDPAVGPATAWEDFAYAALLEELAPGRAPLEDVVAVLKALVRQSFGALGRGDEEAARGYHAFAEDLYDAAVRTFGGELVPAFAALVGEVRAERPPVEGKG